MDLFIIAGEPSGDLHGSALIEALLKTSPTLQIGAVAGPRMRDLPIQSLFAMENLSVMGFVDVFVSLPKIIRQFFSIRNQILKTAPKAVVCIDYPGFNLRLAKSLRKKGYTGKIIHFICPTVWAWGKKRIFFMEKYLDMLLTLFPFETACFEKTKLKTQYVGHPLSLPISQKPPLPRKKLLAIFPGSRKVEIERNLPLQIQIAKKLGVPAVISVANDELKPLIHSLADGIECAPPEENSNLMRSCHLALATSGTVTLELALHQTPTVVGFAIKPFDLFLAQKIFRINLPFYCIVNIIASKRVFPELFGPHFSEAELFFWAEKLWLCEETRKECLNGCLSVLKSLGTKDAAKTAAESIMEAVAF